jgi:hypothetical protein
MTFDKLANQINENFMPEARKPNPEFQKWKAENPGVPVYKFYKMQRDKKAGLGSSVPISEPSEEPEISTLSKDPATERTRLAVADYIAHNPNASVDEIIDAIAIDSTEETPLNLDPAVVKAIVDQESSMEEPDIEGPSLSDIKKDELSAKYDRMRQALYRARGFKARPGRRGVSRDVEGEPEEDTPFSRRGINMRDEPFDPNEL